MASSGMTRKDMAQMFKKIGWKRKEESAAPPPSPSSQPAAVSWNYVQSYFCDNCFWLLLKMGKSLVQQAITRVSNAYQSQSMLLIVARLTVGLHDNGQY